MLRFRMTGPELRTTAFPRLSSLADVLDENVPGDGFGLNIVKELIELYGGSIRLKRSDNGGLHCLLTLPAVI